MTRLAAILLVVLLIAAPRPELHVIPASGPRIALSAPWSSSSESGNLGASTSEPQGAPVSMPAIFQTTATWCAPTATQCTSWGGNAKLAALPGFHGKPYRILVTYGSRAVIVTVVSVCWCGVDLSKYAFSQLADPSVGRINVTVEGPISLPALPATDAEAVQ